MFCGSIESVREIGRVICEGACPKLDFLFVSMKDKDPTLPSGSEGESLQLEEVSTWLSGRGIDFDYYYYD